jgi:hypothetical protein
MRNITRENTYNNYILNNTEKNHQGYYREILQAIESLLYNMVHKHNKVFLIRFDIRYPEGCSPDLYTDNSLLSRFIEALIIHCKRKKYDPQYLWVRERATTGNVHYHFMLLLNGNLIQNGYGILQKATALWQRCMNVADGRGLVHLCEPDGNNFRSDRLGGVMIRRNSQCLDETINACFQWASYLAKCYSKEGLPPYVNGYGCSRG